MKPRTVSDNFATPMHMDPWGTGHVPAKKEGEE